MKNSKQTDIVKGKEIMKSESKPGVASRFSGAKSGKQQYEWQTKLDQAFAELESQGIVARHDFGDSATVDFANIHNEIDKFAKTGGRPIGFTCYHWQDTFTGCEYGQLYISYYSINMGKNAFIEIGKKVRDALVKQGLPVNWNETCFDRILTRVKGTEPPSYENEEDHESYTEFLRTIKWIVENCLVRHGFERDYLAPVPHPDVMLFNGKYSGHLMVECHINGIMFGAAIHIHEEKFKKPKQLEQAITKLNDAAFVSDFTIVNERIVALVAILPLHSVKDKLDLFVPLVKDDLDAVVATVGTSRENSTKTEPFTELPKTINQLVEYYLVRLGFKRDLEVLVHLPGVMQFTNDYSINLQIECNDEGVIVRFYIRIHEKLEQTVANMNSVAHLLKYTAQEDQVVLMSAVLPLIEVKTKLEHFIKQVKKDLDAFCELANKSREQRKAAKSQ